MKTILISEWDKIKDHSNKEHWLRNYVTNNPVEIGLGELIALNKEVTNKNGSMDVLLASEDKETHYNTEIQLGNADSKHILKTLSYYKEQQRLYPHKKHYAVIIAESFNGQLRDAMEMLCETFPYIAIKASVYEIKGESELNFEVVVNRWTQQAVEEPSYEYGETYWSEKDINALNTARIVADHLGTTFHTTKHNCIVQVNNANFFHFQTGKDPEIAVFFGFDDNIKEMVDAFPVKFNTITGKNDIKTLRFDSNRIEEYMPLFEQVYKYKLSQ